jgi:hypothetical protein
VRIKKGKQKSKQNLEKFIKVEVFPTIELPEKANRCEKTQKKIKSRTL